MASSDSPYLHNYTPNKMSYHELTKIIITTQYKRGMIIRQENGVDVTTLKMYTQNRLMLNKCIKILSL